MKTPPSYSDVYSIRLREDVDGLAERLTAAGYLVKVDYSGVCHTDDDGEHYHPYGLVVSLTPEQARKLGGGQGAAR